MSRAQPWLHQHIRGEALPSKYVSSVNVGLAALLLAFVATALPQEKPCCYITGIDMRAGLVSAKVNTTDQSFQFKPNTPVLIVSMKVGEGVYANFKTGQVSLNGKDVVGAIISVGRAEGPLAPAVPSKVASAASTTKGNPPDGRTWGVASTVSCCAIAGIDSRTGLVYAHVNATGQPFIFFVKDSATRQTLKAMQGVYANFTTQQVSLDGRSACCPILILGKSPRSQPLVARRILDVPAGEVPFRSAAMPPGRFILSGNSPTGSPGNPGVVVPVDWARRASLPVRSSLPGGRYAIISAAQYNALAGRAIPGVSPLEMLFRQGRGGFIDGYYLVDTTASGTSTRPPMPPYTGGGGGVSGGTGGTSGTGGTTVSTDPTRFIANARPGDILFASHPGFNYFTYGEFNHAAIVITPNFAWGNTTQGEAVVAEETADYPGTDKPGARLVLWSDFVDPSREYNKIMLGRVRGLSEQQMNALIDWALSRLGRPYRWPTDVGAKDDDNRMYCSQYVWIDYLRNMNIDLDSDGGYTVFPDDIYYDQYVEHIGELDLPTDSSWWPF